VPSGNVNDGVEDRQRGYPFWAGRGELETYWPADVMHHEMEAIKIQRSYGVLAESPEIRPAVIVVFRPVRQSESRKIPGHSAKPSQSEFVDHLPEAERRAKHPVNAHDGLAIAFAEQEARYATGGERPAGATVSGQDSGCDVN
jgi:hypothetical protein